MKIVMKNRLFSVTLKLTRFVMDDSHGYKFVDLHILCHLFLYVYIFLNVFVYKFRVISIKMNTNLLHVATD